MTERQAAAFADPLARATGELERFRRYRGVCGGVLTTILTVNR